jgi:DNA-binding NarL/FixJ family response regulator
VTPTRVLIADPLPVFRSGVTNLLRREGDFELLEAATGEEAELVALQSCPDVVLVDLDVPPGGAVPLVRRLGEICRGHTIVWGFDPDPTAILAAVRAGASGFLHKEIAPAGLLRALRGVVVGEAPLARDLAGRLIDALHAFDAQAEARERAACLSPRELEVLELVAAGARNREIAGELGISEFTVKRHVQNIFAKLDVDTRLAASEFYRTVFVAAGDLDALGRSA